MSEFSTLNGYKVKDKKAIRYYDTVSNMIADTTLKANMYVKTKGYYDINDGGNAEYHIVSSEDNTQHQEILNNGLYANLINFKSFKQFGKTSENNITEFEFNLIKNQSNIIDLDGLTLELTNGIELSDITLKNGKIRMGTAQAEILPEIDYCLLLNSNVNIENIDFSNINALYVVISNRGVKNIKIENCKFINNAFSDVMFEVENENIEVNNCIFDGIVYTPTDTYLYRYMIATGSIHTIEENSDYSFGVRNCKFTNNICKNNPLWEGIDTHGAENLIVENNYIENCQTGIMLVSSSSILTKMPNNNIQVKNNKIVGTNITRAGIEIGGNNIQIGKNYNIENNDIYNCSNLLNNDNHGAIRVGNSKNVKIINNNVYNNLQNCILLFHRIYNLKIQNNYLECNKDKIINFQGYGIINIDISNNTMNGKNHVGYAMNPTFTRGKIENNTIYNCTHNQSANPYNYKVTVNGVANMYVNLDDEFKDLNNGNSYKVTSNSLNFGRNFNSTYTGSGTSGSNYIETNVVPFELVEGLSIKIGDDSYVVDYFSDKKLYLTTNLVNNYTNASITPVLPTLQTIS